jgi:hypothetical protein
LPHSALGPQLGSLDVSNLSLKHHPQVAPFTGEETGSVI